ncbi:trypsin-like peptidase domain-containing protein [Sorangium sp. So ce385]|uniref:trypsin-like peptidase domain-containing protein n=1 Tax=Sorangium sp. So ce385 TaxID=3133308 RepID=UPI003F5B49B9
MKILAHPRTSLSLFLPLTCLAAAAGCASPLPEEPTAVATMESQCGFWDPQDVELYDGTLGVTQAFVDQHEMPVGLVPSRCSGTLIARNLFLSTGSCYYQVGDTVSFNYQVDAQTGVMKAGDEFKVIEVVEQQDDANYNYSLVRLDLPAADRYGTARIFDRDPSGGELLTVISHPDDVNGIAKRVSTGSEAGASTVGDNWFQHRADTTFVSPGAGVLDSAGRLIGVNTDGGCHPVFPFGANSALKMTALLDHSTTLQNLGSDGIWFSNGNNTFTKNSLTVRGHFIPFTGDFDGDGDDDVFWYGRGSGADFIWWSTGGAFTEQSVTVGGLYVPFVGNFDGQHGDDIFWYGPEEKADYIWWSDGDQTFTSESKTVFGDYIPVAGDFDGDDDDDIFWYGRKGRADGIWWSNGGSFTMVPDTVSGDYFPIAGDFDDDGDDDIFWYAPGSASSGLWWSNGTFFNKVSVSVGGYYMPFVGNFDGQHGDDIFWYAPGSVADGIWSSNGTGWFSWSAHTVSGQYHGVSGDFNNDGDSDIIWYGGPAKN